MRAGEGDVLTRVAAGSGSAAQWPAVEYERMVGGARGRFCLVAETTPDALVGFITGVVIRDEGEILNVVVDGAYRRRGIGAALTQAAIARMKHSGVRTVWLEARESNHAAHRLYARLGFQQRGQRKAYYTSPVEDALLFYLTL